MEITTKLLRLAGNGARIEGILHDMPFKGKLRICQDGMYVCQNVREGAKPDDGYIFDYKYSWIFRTLPVENLKITKLEISVDNETPIFIGDRQLTITDSEIRLGDVIITREALYVINEAVAAYNESK